MEAQEIQRGARALLSDYVKVLPKDRVIMAYTPEARAMTARLALELKSMGIEAKTVIMGVLIDEGIRDRLEAALPKPEDLDDGRLVFIAMERSSVSHTDVIPELLARYPQEKVHQVQIINASDEILQHSFNITPEYLTAINTGVLERMLGKHQIRIKTAGGTDLRATVDSDRAIWISSRGAVAHAADIIILPAGEVATLPFDFTGTLVADGAFSVNAHVESDTRLADHPVALTIEDGFVTNLECSHQPTKSLLERFLSLPHGREVGELGFGTNVGTTEFVPMNSFINERHAGVHVGLGQHNQGGFKAPHDTPLHIDFIAPHAKVWVDDDPDPIDFDHLEASRAAHPDRTCVLSEDVETDCCGIRRGQAARFVPRLEDLVRHADVSAAELGSV